jgi:hypothetical protein
MCTSCLYTHSLFLEGNMWTLLSQERRTAQRGEEDLGVEQMSY